MSLRQRKLTRAVKALSKYYGLRTVKDTAEYIALTEINNNPAIGDEGAIGRRTEIDDTVTAESKLVEWLIDTADGAYTTVEFVQKIKNIFNRLSESDKLIVGQNFVRILTLVYEKGNNFSGQSVDDPNELNAIFPPSPGEDNTAPGDVGIRKVLGYEGDGNQRVTTINSLPLGPTKTSPGLSAYVLNSPSVTLESQNINASTIFLNGIPNVELMRAVPYVNVEFFFPRAPLSGIGQQLQNLSLNKFLLGAVRPGDNSVTRFMADSDTVSADDVQPQHHREETQTEDGRSPTSDIYSAVGMELFTSPQTLVNTDDVSISVRSNKILDKFQPLMTLKDLEIKIAPSRGLISFKTGTMSFTLHDRSRLAEVAEFIRADLYGKNEITIEYGWSHPDGGINDTDNPYGALIDGLRIKEKFMVTNSSFTFDAAGQVSIKLQIAMRGVTEMNTELMSSDASGTASILRDIRKLQQEITELSNRVFHNVSTTSMTEVRGHQILNAAQDALSNPTLGTDLLKALHDFRARYQSGRHATSDTTELVNKLNELFGADDTTERNTNRRSGNTRTSDGTLTRFASLRGSIQESISKKVENLVSTVDPFFQPIDSDHITRNVNVVHVGKDERLAQAAFHHHGFTAGNLDLSNGQVSLAKLLLSFIGEPLANTKNYDEVQMFFYPFNEYAGQASKINIANFIVDVKYFADELARYRLSHISRTSVMSLNQFMDFIADILLDDPTAASYGLFDEQSSGGGNLFRTKFTDPEGRVPPVIVPVDDAPKWQSRMEAILRGVTPDGSFRMPQLGIHIETLPGKVGESEENDPGDASSPRSILRLHVYDKTATKFETLGRIMMATQKDQIRSIGNLAGVPPSAAGNTPVMETRREIANSIVEQALSINLIEELMPARDGSPDARASTGIANSSTNKIYRVTGGPEKLKEFIMTNSPYIIFGAGGTTVKSAQVNSMQNSSLATVNLLRSFRREEGTTPSGENLGGLPMNVIPTVMNLECVGNPLLDYMQSYYIDLHTGTTVDNLYAVTGLEHKFTQGDFTTSVKLTPIDAWGSFRSLVSTIGASVNILADAHSEENSFGPAAEGGS